MEHPEDPKDDGGKVPGFAYAWMIPYLTRVARRHGYALAVHGSMSKDLDVIAIPWVLKANPAEELVAEMARLTDGRLKRKDGTLVLKPQAADIVGCETIKEHGRKAYTIVFKGAWHYIDLSVMPTISNGKRNSKKRRARAHRRR